MSILSSSTSRGDVPYLPIRTIVKFYDNHETTNTNKLMSKTLGKVAFIDNQWFDKTNGSTNPLDGEFWLVDVMHETCANQSKGCFLLYPIRKVDATSLNRLLPGMYSEKRCGGCLVLEPKTGGINWLLPLNHKRSIRDIYAVIVTH